MAKLNDILLPERLNACLVALLDEVPDSELEQAGREFLSGGFTKAPAIKKRLAALIQRPTALPPWLEELLWPCLPGKQAVQSLSFEMIRLLLDNLAAVVGPDPLALCLISDDRPDILNLGKEQLARLPAAPQETGSQAAVDLLLDILEMRLLNPLGISLSPSEPVAVPPSSAPSPDATGTSSTNVSSQTNPEERIRKLESFLKDEKKRHKAQLRRHEDQHRIECEKLLAEKESLRQRLQAAESTHATLQTQIDQIKTNQETAIQEGVKHETSLVLRKWLEPASLLESQAQEMRDLTDDLLTRAERAMQLQASQDRHTGNRLQLRAQLKALRQARDQIEDTRQNALHPLPELSRMEADLEREITRLEGILAEDRPEDPALSHLLAQINQATQPGALGPVCRLLEALQETQLLAKWNLRRLYDALHRKYSLLAEHGQQLEDGETCEEGWSLRQLIGRNHPALILVDGHNVLFGLEDLFGPFNKDGHPGPEARQKLTDCVCRLARHASRLEVTLYFDGPAMQTTTVSTNVRVEFSGGTGPNRADRRIASDLAFRKTQEPNRRLFVVSDDREIRQEALRQGARFVPVGAFAVLLTDLAAR